MSDSYPIIEIKPEWVLEPETLGGKKKFWYRERDQEPDWLFKYPRPNTGEHWAEKIAAEIANVLSIRHAHVDLALFDGVRGSATRSFTTDGWNLFLGNQILAGQVLGYDLKKKRFGQSNHTLKNIFLALTRIFDSEDVRDQQVLFAEYLVFDAVIANTDRHHENWGILLKQREKHVIGKLAPSFDHASSLGRELQDEGKGKSRRRLLDEGRVGAYAEKAPGAIYWNREDKSGLSPLELVRRGAAQDREIFTPALARIRRLDRSAVEEIVRRMPDGWMTPLAQRFVVELVCYNVEALRRIP